MDIVVFGGDGYIGWPLAVELALRHPDKSILVADNFLTRRNAAKVGGRPLAPICDMPARLAAFRAVFGQTNLHFREIDCADTAQMTALFAEVAPETVYHLAHQRAAPYSMLGLAECVETVTNNEVGFLNLIWLVKERVPDCHVVKLGSFGAYAKPGLDIPEGDAHIAIGGQVSAAPAPFPRASDDFYHVTKINDGAFAGLAARKWGLRITDVMQSTVFGVGTARTLTDDRLATRFDYDEVLGTVANRFVVQALAGLPLTVYGRGTQTSGIMVLEDCVQVLAHLAGDAPARGTHRIVNNSPQSYAINEIAEIVLEEGARRGLAVEICRNRWNPRFEDGVSLPCKVETAYLRRLLTPTPLAEAIGESLDLLRRHAGAIDRSSIDPTHDWLGATMRPAAETPRPAAARSHAPWLMGVAALFGRNRGVRPMSEVDAARARAAAASSPVGQVVGRGDEDGRVLSGGV